MRRQYYLSVILLHTSQEKYKIFFLFGCVINNFYWWELYIFFSQICKQGCLLVLSLPANGLPIIFVVTNIHTVFILESVRPWKMKELLYRIKYRVPFLCCLLLHYRFLPDMAFPILSNQVNAGLPRFHFHGHQALGYFQCIIYNNITYSL